jgi:uncharacterized protein (DUF58 family)
MRFLTRRGLGFILAAVGLFVIGDVTRTGWVQIADSVFWGAIVISAIVPAFSSGGLTASPRFFLRERQDRASGPAQGDEVGIEADIVNHWPVPRFGVTLTYDLYVNEGLTTNRADERVRLFVPFIAPLARMTVTGSMRPPLRGLHRLANGVASSDAPFGLFKRRQRQAADTSLLVYPAPVEVELSPSRLVQNGERPRPVTARIGDDIAGSRPYVRGDARRDIHWRNSARAGRMMTKAYAATEQETPVLLVARGTSIPNADRALDDRCRVAAGVALASGASGVPLSLLAGRDARAMTWPETLAHLASLSSATAARMRDQLNRLAPSASVAVIVDVADDESISAVASGAPRLSSLDVWLLADEADKDGWSASHVASALQSVGAHVSVVTRPLPAPEVRE